MKCAGCKEEFSGLKALNAHKPFCPTPAITTRQKKEIREQKKQIANQVATKPDEQNKPSSDELLIPLSMCPQETKLYSLGKSVGFKVTGILTKDGVRIQEVKLIR